MYPRICSNCVCIAAWSAIHVVPHARRHAKTVCSPRFPAASKDLSEDLFAVCLLEVAESVVVVLLALVCDFNGLCEEALVSNVMMSGGAESEDSSEAWLVVCKHYMMTHWTECEVFFIINLIAICPPRMNPRISQGRCASMLRVGFGATLSEDVSEDWVRICFTLCREAKIAKARAGIYQHRASDAPKGILSQGSYLQACVCSGCQVASGPGVI